jgi:hypothetical protein
MYIYMPLPEPTNTCHRQKRHIHTRREGSEEYVVFGSSIGWLVFYGAVTVC